MDNMEKRTNELYLDETKGIDSLELLNRFTDAAKKDAEDSELASSIISSIDIVTAIYYFRMYSSVEDFLQKHLSGSTDYFLLQWVRSTWDRFSKMSEEELSNLCIEQLSLGSQE